MFRSTSMTGKRREKLSKKHDGSFALLKIAKCDRAMGPADHPGSSLPGPLAELKT